MAKQLSVFIENRKGRLGEVLGVLKENDINIVSLSLADTTEYGLLRLIVSDPQEAQKILTAAGFSAMLTSVLVVKIPHKAGSLQGILETLSKNGYNIEYMYGLSIVGETASIVMKVSDYDGVKNLLDKMGIARIKTAEIAKL